MSLETTQRDGALVLAVKGEFSAGEAAAVDAALAAQSEQKNVIFDLESCRFLTSAALESMLGALRICEERGGRVVLAGIDPNCRKILEITRLDHRFERTGELATALRGIT